MIRRLKHFASLATDAEYREFHRLLELPRKQPGVTSLLGPELSFVDGRSCALQHLVMFKNNFYAMTSAVDNPRILDAGANIGMASLYFKRMFPKARISAFEADPIIAGVLQKNLSKFGYSDVAVHTVAVSDCTTTMKFSANGSDGGRLGDGGEISVPVVRMRDWLDGPIDLLKLDIEGEEFKVILDCKDRLENVSKVFVEYHSFESQPQRLPEILTILRDASFRLYVQTDFCPPTPLKDQTDDGGMDLRLNIFGIKHR
jgi:FkbM family methyltransferase